MHKEDQDIHDMLSHADIPAHSADLSERIIAHAFASQPAIVKTGSSFSLWWGEMKAQHGQKMALAAALAAICIIVFDPAGKITKQYMETKQVADAKERYYVDGVPLLADLTLMEEPDLKLEEVVIFAEQG